MPGSGLASSRSPALDFLDNGFAVPMELLFLFAAAIFVAGVVINLRRWRGALGGRAGKNARAWATASRLVDLALLQRKMLSRPFSAWMHLPLFWGFLVLALGSFLILVDSYVLRTLGILLPRGGLYALFQACLEVAGIALVFGVSLALYRRFFRRREGVEADRRAPVLLLLLLGMALSGFLLEGLRIRIESGAWWEPWSFAGSAVARLLAVAAPPPAAGLLMGYRVLWWCHALTAFGIIAAIPYSRLRHAFASPLHIAIAPGDLSGRLRTPFDLRELMKEGRFDVAVGARTLADLTGPERLALSACADFGRCREVCPAHETGTPLSPQRLMGALRRESEAARPRAGDAPPLVEGAVTSDEVWSCTLCGACTGSCPVLADPLDRIVQLRRGLVAANRSGRSREEVLANLSRAGNPYGAPRADRSRVAEDLGVRPLEADEKVDLLYWIGCAATYDPRSRGIARAMVRILNQAGVRFGVLGAGESCNGELARRVGEEGLFQDLALGNIRLFERHGVGRILTHCAHCFNTFRNEYPEFGGRFEVVHHTGLLEELLREGRLRPAREIREVATLHDSCYLARFNRSIDPPRAVLRAIPGLRSAEMPRRGASTFCCGAGGGNYWYEVPRRTTMTTVRLREAEEAAAGILVSECPFCLKMFEDGLASRRGGGTLRVRDVAELVAESLGAAP